MSNLPTTTTTPVRIPGTLGTGTLDNTCRTSSHLLKAFNKGGIGAYGSTPEERQRSTDYWRKCLDEAIVSNDKRGASRAQVMLNKFDEYDQRLLESVDKAQRLEQGEATENYTFGTKVEFRGNKQIKEDG